jgi:hypothetical protein
LGCRRIHWWDTGWYDGWRGTWAKIAGNYSVTIVLITGKDVEWVVIACMALMDQWYLCLMALGVVMLLDVEATLSGGVVTTLGYGATIL